MTAIPELIEQAREKGLAAIGSSVDGASLAKAVQSLSDFYIAHPRGVTPWERSFAVAATLGYYMPLNATRLVAAAREPLERGFFRGLDHLVDFGSGPGTASLALTSIGLSFQEISLVDRSPEALKWASFLLSGNIGLSQSDVFPKLQVPERSLFVASYSLTETELPPAVRSMEALVLLEPSTSEDARALMARREQLQDWGFHIWAPCVQTGACPLLKNSKRDWCHDRVALERPPWLAEIESHLPFRNQTLTWTALFARKATPPDWPSGSARLVGDLLVEKGKNRQMVCRSEEREFLAWMHRDGQSPVLPRGGIIRIPTEARKVSNEIRMPKS